jgi:hypothetical protein
MSEELEIPMFLAVALFFIAALIGCLGGCITGHSNAIDAMQRQAIENNAAHYDAKTAAFTWNTQEARP